MREHATSNRLAVDQPTRGADRNRSLADQVDPATDEMLLPQLDDGITLLDVQGSRGVPILQPLVLDHLLLNDGPAFLIDANGHAMTTTLAQIAPSQRLLNRIHVARGFTAYQHYGAVCDLPTAVNKSIRTSTAGSGAANRRAPSHDEDTSSHTPALIIAPAVGTQYRADDALSEIHAKTLQARTLARLATYAEGYEIPVLATRAQPDDFVAMMQETVAAHGESAGDDETDAPTVETTSIAAETDFRAIVEHFQNPIRDAATDDDRVAVDVTPGRRAITGAYERHR